MPGDSDSRRAGGAAAPERSSLRRLAATLPSFDDALDDFIARANQTEVVVGEDDVVSEIAVDDAMRGQLAGLHGRIAEVEIRDWALPGELAGLHGRVAAAPVSEPGRARRRSWRWPAVAGSFVAGLAVMFAVSRLALDRSAAPDEGVPEAARSEAPPATPGAPSSPNPALIVTPIDPPSGLSSSPASPPSTGPSARPGGSPEPSGRSADPARGRRTPSPFRAIDPAATGGASHAAIAGRPQDTAKPPAHDAAPAASLIGSPHVAPAAKLVDPFAEPAAPAAGSSAGEAGSSAAAVEPSVEAPAAPSEPAAGSAASPARHPPAPVRPTPSEPPAAKPTGGTLVNPF